MSWIMTIAAGVALGYFAVQFLTSRERAGAGADGEKKGNGWFANVLPEGRLHKSASNRQVAGVCGGIAEYLHADPTIVRLATLLLILGWGSGLLAYLICALVMPAE